MTEMGLCEITTTPEAAWAASGTAGQYSTYRNVLLRTRDQGSGRKRARLDTRSSLPQGLGALQILRLGLHGSPRGRKFVPPTRPTFLGSPNPLRRFPTEEPQPGFLSGGGACTTGLDAGARGPGPTATPRPRG